MGIGAALRNSKAKMYLLHAAAWIILLLSPMMYIDHDSSVDIKRILVFCMNPLMLIVVFYLNYLWLAPKVYAAGKHGKHILINIVVITVLGIALHEWMQIGREMTGGDDRPPVAAPVGAPEPGPAMAPFPEAPEGGAPGSRREGYGTMDGATSQLPQREERQRATTSLLFILRDMFNMAVAAIIATAVCLAERWQKTENARKEAERERTAAELKNLRAQINPHFLLNTLNNIYALTAFDQARAQKAIEQLSRLLRHMLYDNEGQLTDLSKELAFLGDYVDLMRLRVNANVDVEYTTDIAEGCHPKIAPLIFISLVENAFKHGVSPVEKSYIRIHIGADKERIWCHIANSNFPKTSSDKSGHGIGLQQVERRLELLYPDSYEWSKGTSDDEKEYSSKITLYYNKSNANEQ